MKEIFLLTGIAENFFYKLDNIAIPRNKAGIRVKQSIEFITAYTASAACMVKTNLGRKPE